MRNRNLIAWSFYNPNNPAEVVDVIITHDLSEMRVVKKKVRALSIPIVAVADLVDMKQAAGREQDLADIAALERLK